MLEAVVRIREINPSVQALKPLQVIYEEHPILGWVLKPGDYSGYVKVPGQGLKRVHILEGGSRAVSAQPVKGKPRILALGCSYLFGWGLSDQETFLYKIQSSFQRFEFVNDGTPGYGTYQSLLRLEDELKVAEKPKAAIYFWTDTHDVRNEGWPQWLKLLRRHGQEKCAAAPYVRLDEKGNLKHFPPTAFPAWPLENTFHLIRAVKNRYYDLPGPEISSPALVTQKLTAEMNRRSLSRRTLFGVVILESDPELKAEYLRFLKSEGIPHADCSALKNLPETRIPGDGHPNAAVNREWAACVERSLPEIFPGVSA